MSTLLAAPTVNCLQDFGQRVKLAAGVSLLAEFTKVTPETALGWFRLDKGGEIEDGRGLPKGGTLLRLRCFLELVGYEVEELRELTEPACHLAWSIALDVVSVEEALKRLKYAENNFQAILGQLLKPVPGLSSDRVAKLRDLVAENVDKRETAIEVWRQRVDELLRPLHAAMPVKAMAETSPKVVDFELSPPAAGVILANSLQTAACVLRQLETAGVTEREAIFAMVVNMVGTDDFETIGVWVNEVA